MTHLKLAEVRSTETPAATMRTYTSPTADVPSSLAVWRTEMAPGSSGPAHSVDTDHVVIVLEGVLVAEVDGARHEVGAGDALKLPAGSARRLGSGDGGPLVTLTAAQPGSTARVGDSEPVPVPWAR